jgi:hypothetical protein
MKCRTLHSVVVSTYAGIRPILPAISPSEFGRYSELFLLKVMSRPNYLRRLFGLLVVVMIETLLHPAVSALVKYLGGQQD